jgi:CRISPR type III-associated protein (TIGR04423 family)
MKTEFMIIEKLNGIIDIPQLEYIGYLWFSDSHSPTVFNSEIIRFETELINPFIIEGWLWNESSMTAIHIQHSGHYIVRKYNMKEFMATAECEVIDFLPNRMPGIDRLRFVPLWIEENDEMCQGMPVLQSKGYVFVGFKK